VILNHNNGGKTTPPCYPTYKEVMPMIDVPNLALRHASSFVDKEAAARQEAIKS